LWRGQTDTARWIDAWCDLVTKWEPIEWGEEGGQIRGAVGPFIDQRAKERGAYTFRRQLPSKADKSVRAQPIRGLMSMRGLHVPTSEPWYPEFRAELLSFPAGKHDDQVDALGLVGQIITTLSVGKMEKPKLRIGRSGREAWMGG
jgi:predicted phage terminase large subunit-like protein